MKITPMISTTPNASIPAMPGFRFSFSDIECEAGVAATGAVAAIILPSPFRMEPAWGKLCWRVRKGYMGELLQPNEYRASGYSHYADLGWTVLVAPQRKQSAPGQSPWQAARRNTTEHGDLPSWPPSVAPWRTSSWLSPVSWRPSSTSCSGSWLTSCPPHGSCGHIPRHQDFAPSPAPARQHP